SVIVQHEAKIGVDDPASRDASVPPSLSDHHVAFRKNGCERFLGLWKIIANVRQLLLAHLGQSCIDLVHKRPAFCKGSSLTKDGDPVFRYFAVTVGSREHHFVPRLTLAA